MAASQTHNQAVSAVVKSVLTATRPEELVLVDSIVWHRPGMKRDEILGFGMGPELELMAPVLIEFLREAAKSSLKSLAELLGQHLVKDLASPAHVKIDPTKLVTLRTDLGKRLLETGFEEQKVSRIGDSLVSVLIENPNLISGLVAD